MDWWDWESVEKLTKVYNLAQVLLLVSIVGSLIATFAIWKIGNRVDELSQERIEAAEAIAKKTREELAEAREKQVVAERALRAKIAGIESSAEEIRGQTEKIAEQGRPRVLTEAQHKTLVGVLKRYPAQKISMVELGDPEAGAYAKNLTKAIVAAGWRVEIAWAGMLIPPRYGIVCEVVDPGNLPVAAQAIRDAFSEAGIPISIEGGSRSQINLIVGLKPK